MSDRQVKCCRCRNKHLESERIKKPSKKWGVLGRDLVCPRCECTTYYVLDEVKEK